LSVPFFCCDRKKTAALRVQPNPVSADQKLLFGAVERVATLAATSVLGLAV